MAQQIITKSQGDICYIETLWQMQKLKSIAHSIDLKNFLWDLKINHTVTLNTWLKLIS